MRRAGGGGMMINLFNIDCMEFMRDKPDGYYDLAVVDPPYYDNAENIITPGGRISTTGVARSKKYHMGNWKAPTAEYFEELRRISKHQIVWGVNYFDYPLPGGRIVWDKISDNGAMLFSHCELAYCSMIGKRIVIYRYRWNGMLQGEIGNKKMNEQRIHPTQKPVALYAWILENYAKPGWKLLDTHGGSCSSGIAAHNAGLDMDICELDMGYYAAAKERLERHQMQQQLPFAQAAAEEPQLFGEPQ